MFAFSLFLPGICELEVHSFFSIVWPKLRPDYRHTVDNGNVASIWKWNPSGGKTVSVDHKSNSRKITVIYSSSMTLHRSDGPQTGGGGALSKIARVLIFVRHVTIYELQTGVPIA
jgi:hypothetical protein